MFRRTLLGAAAALMLTISGAAFGAARAANSQTRAQLDRLVPNINFTNVTLKEAVEFLRDVSDSNVHVNWKAIEAAGVTQDTQINIKLRQVTLGKVLRLLLTEASGGAGLTFYIEEGVIEITTSELADNQMYTVVYPVQDLLVEAPVFVAPPDFMLRGNNNGGNAGNAGGIGFGNANQQQAQPKDKDAKARELVDLIVETVSPQVWAPNGGKATIKFFNGNLIVTAPRSVHEAIGGPVD